MILSKRQNSAASSFLSGGRVQLILVFFLFFYTFICSFGIIYPFLSLEMVNSCTRWGPTSLIDYSGRLNLYKCRFLFKYDCDVIFCLCFIFGSLNIFFYVFGLFYFIDVTFNRSTYPFSITLMFFAFFHESHQFLFLVFMYYTYIFRSFFCRFLLKNLYFIFSFLYAFFFCYSWFILEFSFFILQLSLVNIS